MPANTTYKTNEYPTNIAFEQHRRIIITVKEMAAFGDIDKLINRIKDVKLDLESAVKLAGDAVDEGIELVDKTIKSQKKVNGKKFKGSTTLWICALPLPNELNENQSHQWDTTEGFVGSTLGGLADKNIAGLISVSKMIGEISSKTNNRKQLVNPGYFQDYRGTKPREFNFTWDLIPNNKKESNEIFEILLKLKKYTLPTLNAGGLGLQSPYLFDITIGNEKINSIMGMNNVVCTNMGIGYSADNSLQMMGDGTPKHMTLTMGFAERSTVLASDYPI